MIINNAVICDTDAVALRHGSIGFSHGSVCEIENADSDDVIDARGAYLLPGFVDVHTHGRAGGDFVSADTDKLRVMARSYLETGVTSVMPTLASAAYGELISAADRINSVKSSTGGARFLGIHLEGRYLNPDFRGAHNAELLAPLKPEELDALVFRMCLPCHITAALELDGDERFADRALSLGATLGLGHTGADFNTAHVLFEKYGISFTHLFNAMPPIHHRAGGAAVAGLTSGAFCELICDGLHVSPEMVRLAYGCLTEEHLVLITDSMEATGCPDGDYDIAGSPCRVVNGRALTADGKLAGSTLDLKTAVENLMSFCNIGLVNAVRCATLNPAREIGADDTVGSLAVGKRADALLVRLENGKIFIEDIFIGGERI